MQERKTAGFFLEVLIIMVIFGTLTGIAVPRVNQMIARADVAAQESELHSIQAAVIAMLYDSDTHALEPVGPTSDMSEVLTSDAPPLVLADYLDMENGSLYSGCNYTFTAKGKVIQVLP